jgi:hypothetical protein
MKTNSFPSPRLLFWFVLLAFLTIGFFWGHSAGLKRSEYVAARLGKPLEQYQRSEAHTRNVFFFTVGVCFGLLYLVVQVHSL